MAKKLRFFVFVLLMVSHPWTLYAASTAQAKSAIILVAFGTTTNAFPSHMASSGDLAKVNPTAS